MSIKKQSIQSVLVKALSIALGLLLVAVLARTLSPENYGIYSVALASITVLAVPTALGLPNYVVREIARAMADADAALPQQILRSAVVLVLIVSVLIVGLAGLWVALSNSGSTYASTLLIGRWLIPIMALIQVMGAALRGIENVAEGLLLGLVARHFLFFVLLVGWLSLSAELSPQSAMGLHVVAAFLALCFGLLVWRKYRPAKPDSSTVLVSVDLRKMLMSTGVMGIIAGAQTLNANLDVIMLGWLRDAQTAGIYKLASTVALLTVAGLQAINMVMMSHFARTYREGNMERLQAIATRSVRMILLTAVPSSVLLVILGRQFIEIVFGAEYLASYMPMVILVVGQLVSALFGSVITILNMTGHEKDTMKGILVGSLLNIVLNAALIPPFGAEGAAFATASTVVFWNVTLHIMVRRRLSITSTPFRM
jgi:O-antigen/teichoic acid export membrane protein